MRLKLFKRQPLRQRIRYVNFIAGIVCEGLKDGDMNKAFNESNVDVPANSAATKRVEYFSKLFILPCPVRLINAVPC